MSKHLFELIFKGALNKYGSCMRFVTASLV